MTEAVQGRAPTTATATCGFVGRARELRQLHADRQSAGLSTLSGRPAPRGRVLLIAGRPGSGRTALAERFVRQVASDYPDGVLRARLTGPGGLPVPTERTARELLATLRSRAAAPGADQDDLTAVLRGELAGRRMLLFFDDVAATEQLLELLPDDRGCLVVAVAAGPLTSLPDVRPCVIGGLDRNAAVAMLRSGSGSAHRLTVDPLRAQALAEACGDLPAALRMIGGWLAARPELAVSDATARLEETPGGTGARVPDRLGRVFRLVYGSLSPSAARLLRLLSLAPGGVVDVTTASALAGRAPEVVEGELGELSSLGLLRPIRGAAWTLPGCLEPLVRAEARRRERPGEAMLARARMLERTVRRLHACRAEAEPPGSTVRSRLSGMPRALRFTDAREARAWLAARSSALQTAAAAAVVEGGGELDTLARRLALALCRCYAAHRAPEEAAPDVYRLQELILEVADRGGVQHDRAAAQTALAAMDVEAGRLSQAVRRYRHALDAFRAARDDAGARTALESLGATYGLLDDWARAADWYGRALTLCQTAGRGEEVARLHCLFAEALGRAGDRTAALREWRTAAAVHRRLGDTAAQAGALGEVAAEQERAGRAGEAERTYGDALSLARQARDSALQAHLRMRLADLCDRMGDRGGARRHRAAAEVLQDLTDG